MNNDLHAETKKLLAWQVNSHEGESLQDHIRSLDAKVREQEETIKELSWDGALNDAEARIRELEAKLAEAKKHAERYRYLRRVGFTAKMYFRNNDATISYSWSHWIGRDADVVVDEAIAATKEQKP